MKDGKKTNSPHPPTNNIVFVRCILFVLQQSTIRKTMNKQFILLLAAATLAACSAKTEPNGHEEESVAAVKTVHPTKGNISDEMEFRATTQYLRHSTVSASVSSYITATYAQVGQRVSCGQRLFTIETKERNALGGDMPTGDIGLLTICAPQSGVVTAVM